MADKKLNQFTAASGWTATCSVVGSDSASPTGSFFWTPAQMTANPSTAKVGTTAVNGSAATFMRSDAAPPIDLTMSPTWTGQHAFSGHFINALGGVNLSGDGAFGPKMPSWSGGNGFSVISQSGTISYIEFDSQQLCRIASGYVSFGAGGPSVPGSDIALARAAAGVLEVNDGTLGTGHGKAINFPRTAADADAPAPASGATLYSKVVGGKNALFARFPTGAVQQIAIEP